MDILPRVNFFSSMIPLPPPQKYWEDIHSTISKFIWKGKQPRVKLTTLQRDKTAAGLSLPNFKLYALAFTLRPLSVWFDPHAQVSWKPIEQHLVHPYRLQDVVYSGITPKQAKLQFGPIISHLVLSWKEALKITKSTQKWHLESPIFHNHGLLSDSRPFVFPPWTDRGIYTFKDIYGEEGLRTFLDIKQQYNLPGTSFFFYLRLRSSMKAYGVPWDRKLDSLPFHSAIVKTNKSRGLASSLYEIFLKSTYNNLTLQSCWQTDLACDELPWKHIFNNLKLTSKNPNHQFIHFNFLHRTYLTPKKQHAMNKINSPLCSLCATNTTGSFFHMFQQCPSVLLFWQKVSRSISNVTGKAVPCCPRVLLINDDSQLNFSHKEKVVYLAGLTAAKKMLALRWKPPHDLSICHWSCHQYVICSWKFYIWNFQWQEYMVRDPGH